MSLICIVIFVSRLLICFLIGRKKRREDGKKKRKKKKKTHTHPDNEPD